MAEEETVQQEDPPAEAAESAEEPPAEVTIEALLSEAGTQLDEPDIREELSEEAQRILRLKVPVIVKLAEKTLPLGDIIDLTPGSIVEFSRSADRPLELRVNDKVIGHGVAVKVGEKFGLRIEEILPVEETIRSLGN